MHHYWGFGLRIASEIEFPELLSAPQSDADVAVMLGETPQEIEGSRSSSFNFSYIVNNSECLFTVKGTARYYACNGSCITIQVLNKKEEERTIRLYVLATVMAAILIQRNRLPLHTSAILHNDRLTLFAGSSGAGKSTLLAELMKAGRRVFSDDVVVLSSTPNNKVEATASYPMIKLWDDAIAKLNHPYFESRSFKVRHDLDKYGFFFHSTFNTNSYPIAQIIVIGLSTDNEIALRELQGSEAFLATSRQVYRPTLLQSKEQRLLCFNIISNLVQSARIFEITRPVVCDPLFFLEFVEKKLLLKKYYC